MMSDERCMMMMMCLLWMDGLPVDDACPSPPSLPEILRLLVVRTHCPAKDLIRRALHSFAFNQDESLVAPTEEQQRPLLIKAQSEPKAQSDQQWRSRP